MQEPIGIALLSFAHIHAEGYADQVHDHPDCRTVVIWDEDETRGREQADKRGVPFVSDLETVLAMSQVDGVVVNAPTSRHRDILVAAAEAHKHIFTEKALTITTEEATDVLRAVEDAHVRFMISLPTRCRPEILFAKKVLDEGLLGEVTMMRARIAHMAALDKWFSGGTEWFTDASQAGGGALFDLGCHRVDLMRWFLGEPTSVVAQMNTFSQEYDIDDNMVATVKFRSNALGILDVSWVHRYGPNPLEIYGTGGYLGIDAAPNGPRIQLISSQLHAGDIQGYITPTNLPPALPSPFHQWVSAIKDGVTTSATIYDAWALTQMLKTATSRRARVGKSPFDNAFQEQETIGMEADGERTDQEGEADYAAEDLAIYEPVYALVRAIPVGKVMTYGQVADGVTEMAFTARQVGAALRWVPDGVPWQRVVGAGGALPIAKRSPELRARQQHLLESEGVIFVGRGDSLRVDMVQCQWLPDGRADAQPGLFDE